MGIKTSDSEELLSSQNKNYFLRTITFKLEIKLLTQNNYFQAGNKTTESEEIIPRQ